jgi:hypothetical protein
VPIRISRKHVSSSAHPSESPHRARSSHALTTRLRPCRAVPCGVRVRARGTGHSPVSRGRPDAPFGSLSLRYRWFATRLCVIPACNMQHAT